MIGIHHCPKCQAKQKFTGLCSSCSRQRRAEKAATRAAADIVRTPRTYTLEPRRAGKAERMKKDVAAAQKAGKKVFSSIKRGSKGISAQSNARILEEGALKAMKVILGPFVTKCLRCEQPNPAGSGFLSGTNPDGLEFHHVFRRRGWFFFLGVPLCRTCHEEVENDGDQARADRWIVKDPIKTNQ